MNRSSFSTARDYDTHPAAVRPARLRPSVAPLPRLDEGRVRRASGAAPFGAISNLRALEVPRTTPFYSNHHTTTQSAMKNLRQTLATLAISLAFLPGAFAQQTITQWTFAGDVLTPSTGEGTASNVGGTSSAFATGDGSDSRAWNTASYAAQSTGSGTRGVQFLFSTLGFTDLTFSFAHRASGTASRWSQLDYTIDGGNTWTTGFWNNNGGLSPHDAFYTFNIDFSSINNIVSDQAGFGVRIVSIFSPLGFDQNNTLAPYAADTAYMRANTNAVYSPLESSATGNYAPTGTWRFDDVTLSGTALGAKDLTWNLGTGGTWNTSAANWTTGSGSTTFANADTVTFNNTAGGTITVDAGGVAPASTTISAASGTYTFDGGAIGGGALTKSGNGTAILSASNNYTGGTTIDGGVLQANSNDALGSAAGGVAISGGATLRAGGAIDGTRAVTIGTGGGTIDNNGHNVAVASVTGAGNFTKDGAGTLVVAGALAGSAGGQLSVAAGALQLNGTGNIDFNVDSSGTSFAGDIILQNAGRLRVTSSGTVGGGGRILANTTGGTITLTGSGLAVDYANDIVLADGVSIAIGSTDGNTVTYSGNISGGEDIRFSNSYSSGGGAGTTIISGQNTYGGQTRFHNTDSAVVILSGGDNRLPTGTTLVFGGTATRGGSTLDLNGNNQTVAGIMNDVRANVGTIDNTSETASVLTVGGNTTPANAFSGSIAGNISLVKTGSGTLSLAGNNTFTGAAVVSGGRLEVAQGGQIAAASSVTAQSGSELRVDGRVNTAVSIDSGATLTGSGSFGGSVTVAGTHNPGNSPGLQTFEDGLTYNSTSLLVWELSANTADAAARGTLFSGINVTGGNLGIASGAGLNLVFTAALADNTASTVKWSDEFWDTDRSWTLISFAGGGTSTGNFNLGSIGLDTDGIALGTARANASFRVDRLGDDIMVNYQAVPEPSTYALLALAGAGLAAYRWRNRTRRR